MKNQSKVRVFLPNLLILVAILLHSTTWISAQEVEDESEFDYIKGSEKGPSHWGELKKEWAACKNGKMQSPIDLSSHRVRVVPKLGELKKHYKPQNATVKNRGHDIAFSDISVGFPSHLKMVKAPIIQREWNRHDSVCVPRMHSDASDIFSCTERLV